MHCVYCGSSLAEDALTCPNCGNPVSSVSVLSPEEREAFTGVTIDQNSDGRAGEDARRERQRIRFRHVYVSNSKFSGLLTLAVIGFIVAAILFFAIPLIILLIAAGLVFWFLRRLF